jgi:hypothetical protein
LRDLQARLVAAGMPREAAMAEVSRGAVEGWYGADGEGGASAGLAGRMRARLGPAWDPAARRGESVLSAASSTPDARWMIVRVR